MISIFLGMIAAAAGFWGVFVWWNDFLVMAKGLLPVYLFFAGLVAVVVGLSGVHGKD